jgi:hypothetical protein
MKNARFLLKLYFDLSLDRSLLHFVVLREILPVISDMLVDDFLVICDDCSGVC